MLELDQMLNLIQEQELMQMLTQEADLIQMQEVMLEIAQDVINLIIKKTQECVFFNDLMI